MNSPWQKFVRTCWDDEAAAVALLIAIGSMIASVALFVHWLAAGRYTAAVGLAAMLAVVAGVCIRDYRRGRWSVWSGVVVGIWTLLTIGAVVLAIWIEYGRPETTDYGTTDHGPEAAWSGERGARGKNLTS